METTRKRISFFPNRNLELWKIHPLLSADIINILKRFSSALAFITFIIANTTLAGAISGLSNIKMLFLPNPPMGVVTAIDLVFISISILLLHVKKTNRLLSHTILFFTSVPFFISVFNLFSIITTLPTPVSFLFHLDKTLTSFPIHSPLNLTLLMFFSTMSLFFLNIGGKYSKIGQISAIGVGLILLPSNLNYLYGSEFVFNRGTASQIAISTTFCLNLIVVALLLTKPNEGIITPLTNSDASGFTARRFLAAVYLMPISLGWIILEGYKLGWYDSNERFYLLVSGTIIMFSLLTFWIARSLQEIDIKRKYTEDIIFFLSEASQLLASSLDYKITLKKVGELSVPRMADWCTVEILKPNGKLQQIVFAHSNKKLVAAAKKFGRNYYSNIGDEQGPLHVLKTGESEIYPFITNSFLKKLIKNKRGLQFVKKIHMTSLMIIPLIVEKKTIGIIQFVSTNDTHHFSQAELSIAEELAARASLAIEHSMLYDNAQEAIIKRDEFISTASHELKTPLTSLKVYTEVLEQQFAGKDKKTSLYLSRMNTQINNLTHLIKDLLDVSRIQLGKIAFNFEEVAIDPFIKMIVTDMDPIFTGHAIEIHGQTHATVMADKERLGQVIMNLLTNAVKYSPDAKKIIVHISKTKKHVFISVEDMGMGIDKKNLARIFDRFYQIKDNNSQNSGLGMGLYISKEIIHKHNGTITVKSKKGKGSTFTVALPLHQNQK
ncbi:MAG TPA: GAF domain-containing sensor histidine kinase [Patescibacteria group bacterium]|nr:GAF domain-containing sensor histidine kinase [Patescibacteria group bacterium]